MVHKTLANSTAIKEKYKCKPTSKQSRRFIMLFCFRKGGVSQLDTTSTTLLYHNRYVRK